jgi:hypothetical protein
MTTGPKSLALARILKKPQTRKMFLVQVPVKMVSLDRNPSKMGERRQEQNYLFRWGDYMNTGYDPENNSCFVAGKVTTI